jgi:hypothetical protein
MVDEIGEDGDNIEYTSKTALNTDRLTKLPPHQLSRVATAISSCSLAAI